MTHYVWDGSQVVSEHDGAGALLAEYIYSGNRMIARSVSGVMQYFLGDRLSVRLVLDTSGNVVGRMAHLPFGEDFAESGTQEKHHLTSYEREGAVELDYAVNRAYSPGIGRFLQADPYRPSGYMEDPRSWNRYNYTRNVVTNRVDRLGLNDTPADSCHDDKFGNTTCRATAPRSNDDGPANGGSNPNGFGFGMVGLGGLFEGIGRAKGPPLVDGNGHGPGGGESGDAPQGDCSAEPQGDVSATDDRTRPGDGTWEVYWCSRPLGAPGSTADCIGPFCHVFLCVVKNNIKKQCVGLNPTGNPWGSSPGRNEPADTFNKGNCRGIDNNACLAKCLKKIFGEPLPNYSLIKGPTCNTWALKTLGTCRKSCGF